MLNLSLSRVYYISINCQRNHMNIIRWELEVMLYVNLQLCNVCDFVEDIASFRRPAGDLRVVRLLNAIQYKGS